MIIRSNRIFGDCSWRLYCKGAGCNERCNLLHRNWNCHNPIQTYGLHWGMMAINSNWVDYQCVKLPWNGGMIDTHSMKLVRGRLLWYFEIRSVSVFCSLQSYPIRSETASWKIRIIRFRIIMMRWFLHENAVQCAPYRYIAESNNMKFVFFAVWRSQQFNSHDR